MRAARRRRRLVFPAGMAFCDQCGNELEDRDGLSELRGTADRDDPTA